MSNYVQDLNDNKKQVPGKLPDNAYDRVITAQTCSLVKTPNSVLIANIDGVQIGFSFRNSSSFAKLDSLTDGGGTNSGITASNSSKGITGSNTSFLTDFQVGDKIKIVSSSNDGNSYFQIMNVASIAYNHAFSASEDWAAKAPT